MSGNQNGGQYYKELRRMNGFLNEEKVICRAKECMCYI